MTARIKNLLDSRNAKGSFPACRLQRRRGTSHIHFVGDSHEHHNRPHPQVPDRRAGRNAVWQFDGEHLAMKREGHFPAPVRVGTYCTGWRLSDLHEYDAARRAWHRNLPADGRRRRRLRDTEPGVDETQKSGDHAPLSRLDDPHSRKRRVQTRQEDRRDPGRAQGGQSENHLGQHTPAEARPITKAAEGPLRLVAKCRRSGGRIRQLCTAV